MALAGSTTREEEAGRASARPRLVLAERWLPYAFLAPTLLLLGTFVYWPLLHTVWLSLVEWNLNPGVPSRFVGAENFAAVVDTELFRAAAWNTALYIVAAIPLKVLLPIPIAVFLWSLGSAGNLYRTVLFLPTLISFVVVSIVFLWLLNPIVGHAKKLAELAGLELPGLLTDPAYAIWTVVGIAAWKVIGFNTLLYLAGLASINRDYIEAMRLDGAGDGTIFRRLIWPLLTPTTFFVLVATVIFTVQQVFTPIDILTEGGPANSTTNLFYMVYQYTFLTFNVGYGAAGTIILFLLLVAVTLLKVAVLDRHVQYRQ